jgi:uncharacterized Fe-S center protein
MDKKINRREFIKWAALGATAFLAACQKIFQPMLTPSLLDATELPTNFPHPTATQQPTAQQISQTNKVNNMATVYITSYINSDGLMNIFRILNRKATGNVAVKISSGEPGGHNFLSPTLVATLVREVKGTIVECNTAYGGGRADTLSHERVMEEHGFAAIAPIDIMDADGTISLPIIGGKHLVEDIVGSHFANYGFVVNLAHFKGHAMAGLGGVIKNMSIGIASSTGKSLIHTAGKQTTGFGMDTPQDDFLESMAEAAKGVADYLGENIVYINVMNNLSVDCDCDSHPADPTMKDIGILASLDPVALDQACVDLVYAARDGKDLIERIESRDGVHTIEYAEKIKLGSRKYELVSID